MGKKLTTVRRGHNISQNEIARRSANAPEIPIDAPQQSIGPSEESLKQRMRNGLGLDWRCLCHCSLPNAPVSKTHDIVSERYDLSLPS